MQNKVWSEIGTFLNGLRCGKVKRESYIQLPELAEAEKGGTGNIYGRGTSILPGIC